MKILVTGAGGFIGGHMSKRLVEQGHEVISTDIKDTAYEFPGGSIPSKWYQTYGEPVERDLRITDDGCCCDCPSNGIKSIFEKHDSIDQVYHFAADMGGMGYIGTHGADIMRNNQLITLNVLESCRKYDVKRVMFSSSACVYPEILQNDSAHISAAVHDKKFNLEESDAWQGRPDTYYGIEKLTAEAECEAYAHDYGMDIRVARYHNVYGHFGTYDGGREKAPAALCRKVAQAMYVEATNQRSKIEVWGDGQQTRSFLYIDDCIDATLKLMDLPRGVARPHEPINIGSDQAITIDDLARKIIGISGKNLSITHKPDGIQGVRHRNADLTMCKSLLQWSPEVGYEEGLRKTYEWINEQVNK